MTRAGNTTRLDKLNEEATFEEAKTELLASEAICEEAREELNTLLGVSHETKAADWHVEGRLPAVPSGVIST